jgi:hypothetical protein
MTFSRDTMLRNHLQHNHYPPLDTKWVPLCEAAIDVATVTAEQYHEGFGLDESDLDTNLGQGITVREVLDGFHLWDFVTMALQEQDDAMAAELEFKAGE